MTELYELIGCWMKQGSDAIKHLPSDTIHQRKVLWKAYMRVCRKTRGRAYKVAWHLFFKNENAIARNKYKDLCK